LLEMTMACIKARPDTARTTAAIQTSLKTNASRVTREPV
jgi:hypothetical protein